MTSLYFQDRGLSQETHDAYNRYRDFPNSFEEILHFYISYLHDVAPLGLTVHHIPNTHNRPLSASTRHEIQLLTSSGRIFMSGLVSLEQHTVPIENTAADEAYTKWLDGEFVDQKWRFFTGLTRMRIFESGYGPGDEWNLVDWYDPIGDAYAVSGYMQREFDRLSAH